MTDSNLIQQIKRARAVSTPLVAIETADPAATICGIAAAVEANGTKGTSAGALVQWDFVSGVVPLNEQGAAFVAMLGDFDETKNNPLAVLVKVQSPQTFPEGSILFIHMANRWIEEPAVIQAVWNLRDQFKQNKRMLILLGKSLTMPPELSDDVVTFDEPLPDAKQLAEIVREQHYAAGLQEDEETSGRAVEAIRGLSAFAAEQVTAMSLTKNGLDVDALWERKRRQIEQTPGLKVYRDGESFDDIGGVPVVKQFLQQIMQGHARPNVVVFIDEIEKMLGGAGGDMSGVTQDQLGSLLSYMQDHQAAGMIFIGPPGAAKSAIAKAAGTAGSVPTIQLDLGGAKGSLVGQSERQLRDALKVITAVSGDRSLWIATCNRITDLPPELRRRFTLGTFFFDLPDAAERKAIWEIYIERYGFERSAVSCQLSALPNDEGWTGAEIRQCCDIAWRIGCSLKEAAEFVVPVSRSAADAIRRLREQADGRFLSASQPGVYRWGNNAAATNGSRALSLEE